MRDYGDYEVVISPRALAKAEALGLSRAALEASVRTEMQIQSDMANGDEDEEDDPEDWTRPWDFYFHMFESSDEVWWMVRGNEDGDRTVYVSGATYQELEVTDTDGTNFGPDGMFAGKKIMMPVPDDE